MPLWSRKPKGKESVSKIKAPPAQENRAERNAASIGRTTSPEPTKLAPNQTVNREDFKRRAASSKRQLLALGQIVAVMARNAQYRGMLLGDLESMVFPAIVTGQYLVIEAQAKDDGLVAPVAMALWAVVSPEVDARLKTTLDRNVLLAANEWRCGEIPWLIAAAGDQRLLRPALQRLEETSRTGQSFKLRTKNADGSLRVGGIEQLEAATGASPKPTARRS